MSYGDRFQEPDGFDPCEMCKFDCSVTQCEFKEEIEQIED